MPNTNANNWGSDALISLPAAPKYPIVLDLDNSGFSMTTYGMVVNFNEAQKDDMLSGFFAPQQNDIGGNVQ